jgi:hypothetical protein
MLWTHPLPLPLSPSIIWGPSQEVYKHIYTFTNKYIDIHVYLCAYIYKYIYTHTHIHLYIWYLSTLIFIYTYTHIHTYNILTPFLSPRYPLPSEAPPNNLYPHHYFFFYLIYSYICRVRISVYVTNVCVSFQIIFTFTRGSSSI